ncbi:MAG: 30S ribosomal protein S15 [Bacteroidota bacterium]
MQLSKEDKQQLFQEYSAKKLAQDTGSPESQVALFTHRIRHLTEHLKLHPKDKASKLGLVKLVGKRKKQLAYLQKESIEQYRGIVASLGLRK